MEFADAREIQRARAHTSTILAYLGEDEGIRVASRARARTHVYTRTRMRAHVHTSSLRRNRFQSYRTISAKKSSNEQKSRCARARSRDTSAAMPRLFLPPPPLPSPPLPRFSRDLFWDFVRHSLEYCGATTSRYNRSADDRVRPMTDFTPEVHVVSVSLSFARTVLTVKRSRGGTVRPSVRPSIHVTRLIGERWKRRRR